MAIFPRFNPYATAWTAEGIDDTGTHVVLVNGQIVAKWLIQPTYINNLDIIASSTEGPWLEWRHESGALMQRIPLPGRCTHLQARNNHYLAWLPGPDGPQGYVLDGTFVSSAVRPALTSLGGVWFPPDGCIEPRVSDGGLATSIRHPGPFVEPRMGAPWDVKTHWCVPVDTPGGRWLLRLEDTRLVLHPFGDSFGYVVWVGDTYEPEAQWCPELKKISVIWRDGQGHIMIRQVDTTLPRKNLIVSSPPVEPPPVDPPVEPPVPVPPFSWDNVSFASHSAPDVGTWPITCQLDEVKVVLQASPEDRIHAARGDHQWPVIQTSTWGEIDGSIWAFLPLPDGSWRAGTFDQMRPGQSIKYMERYYGKPYALAFDYETIKVNEPIGYLVSTPARGGIYTTNERTPLVVIKYGTDEVLWQEGTPPVPPPVDPPDPPVDPSLELRVAKIESWIRSFKG